MQDPLTYTELGESNISKKLPEIAMMQYKIAEAKNEKAQKQHADMFTALKYSLEGFNPDLAGVEKGYQAITSKASEIALRQGYAAAQQYIANNKGVMDMLAKMSTAQKEKDKVLYTQLNDKDFKVKDPEGYAQSMQNKMRYAQAGNPTKKDFDDIRAKYGITPDIPDEALRPLIRQNLFGEGENIIVYNPLGDYTQLFDKWAVQPKTTGRPTGINEKDGYKFKGERTITDFDPAEVEASKKRIFFEEKTDANRPVYEKVAYDYKQAGKIPQDFDVTKEENKQQLYQMWSNDKAVTSRLEKGVKSDIITESKIGEGGGFQLNVGGGGNNDKFAFVPTVTTTVDMSGNKDRKVGVLNITKIGSNDGTIKVQSPKYAVEYDESKKQWIRKQTSGDFVIKNPLFEISEGAVSGTYVNGTPSDVTNFKKGVYLKGETITNIPEYNDPDDKSKGVKRYNQTEKKIMIPVDGNMNAVAAEFGLKENEMKQLLNQAIDKHNTEYSGKDFYVQPYEIGGQTKPATPANKQKSNTTVSGGNIRK